LTLVLPHRMLGRHDFKLDPSAWSDFVDAGAGNSPAMNKEVLSVIVEVDAIRDAKTPTSICVEIGNRTGLPLAVAKECGVGTGTVQRIAREMAATRPFDRASAAA
jgi:hypothetical protein